MKILIALSLIVLVISQNIEFDPELDSFWEDFKNIYAKVYSPDEEVSRRFIWENHVADIVRHNLLADLGIHSFRRGLNEYSDLSYNETLKLLHGYHESEEEANNNSIAWVPPSNVKIPDIVDWRKQGLVTPVKNQKHCGSCWAFSTTGALEGQHKRKTGKLISLSEQNLVDCTVGNGGCSGGWMNTAFEYVQKNKGIDTEESYPYIGKDGTCHFKKTTVGATCSGHVSIPEGDEDALKIAVATVGPISVAIDASHSSLYSYKTGIYDEPKCNSSIHSHAMLVVGYGSENGHDYWLVKNSWGESWGMHGYLMMVRNKNNHCGIASKASYPLV